jgi:hypothetical protein
VQNKIIAFLQPQLVYWHYAIGVFLQNQDDYQLIGKVVIKHGKCIHYELFQIMTPEHYATINNTDIAFSALGIVQLLKMKNFERESSNTFGRKIVFVNPFITANTDTVVPHHINNTDSIKQQIITEIYNTKEYLTAITMVPYYEILNSMFYNLMADNSIGTTDVIVENFPHKEVFIDHVFKNNHLIKTLPIDHVDIRNLYDFTIKTIKDVFKHKRIKQCLTI